MVIIKGGIEEVGVYELEENIEVFNSYKLFDIIIYL